MICLSILRRHLVWRTCLLWLTLVVAVAAQAAVQTPGLDEKWRYYRSPHFELYSRSTDRFSRDLLRDMESMRAVFYDWTQLPQRHTAEVTIYLFNDSKNFRSYSSPALRGNPRLLGEYLVGPDRDIISLTAEENTNFAIWVIYTNLTKSLLLRSGDNVPYWLAQGLSMFFGTFAPGAKRCALGEADPQRRKDVRSVNAIDVEQLFLGQEVLFNQARADVFHAKTWALLHYWYIGQNEVPRSEVNRFINYLLRPGPAPAAQAIREKFEQVFHMNYAEMNRRVLAYVRNGRFADKSMPNPEMPAPDSYVSRGVELPEMRERLAELSMRLARDPAAQRVLKEALDGPRAARAAEALAADAVARLDVEGARANLARAVAAGSTNADVRLLLSRLEFARWFQERDYRFRLSDDVADTLRGHLLKCAEQMPETGDLYEMLACVESAAAAPVEKNLELARQKIGWVARPGSVRLALAAVQARQGHAAEALALLDVIPLGELTPAESSLVAQIRAALK